MANLIVIANTSAWSLEQDSTALGFSVIVFIEGFPQATFTRCTVPFGATYAETMTAIRDAATQAAADRGFPFVAGDALQVLGGPQATLADLGGA